jgi:hypothetical protein
MRRAAQKPGVACGADLNCICKHKEGLGQKAQQTSTNRRRESGASCCEKPQHVHPLLARSIADEGCAGRGARRRAAASSSRHRPHQHTSRLQTGQRLL